MQKVGYAATSACKRSAMPPHEFSAKGRLCRHTNHECPLTSRKNNKAYNEARPSSALYGYNLWTPYMGIKVKVWLSLFFAKKTTPIVKTIRRKLHA
jgi:hypothetical protein